MNKNILMKITYISVALIAAAVLSGCDMIPSLDLTEEQSTLIAEYAAGKLLEYAKGHPGGLMLVEDIDRADVNPGLKKEEPEPDTLIPEQLPGPLESDGAPVQTDDQDTAEPSDISASDTEALVNTGEEVPAEPTKTIAEALGIEGATITYDRFETAMTYPDNTELAFTMKAAPGKELLIVHFVLSNPGSSDINAYTDSSNFKVRLMLNGSEKLRGDVTFLDNDLMNYQGLLTPGAQVDSVLVFEIKEGSPVSSMDLLIVEEDGEQTYKLM